ncbi:unnamed protein product [Phytophthora lilii]|uniref:Unnamed protein product n=1 Tax=Phytophthora lilii TaxID=2077276 RepID=A0A9W6WHS3_9STRA|nr:unnamed protein product [Phytophthora lilii]
MLVLKVSEGATDIRVPYGKGIAGTVAATGKAMNISDAYADPNFDSQYDQRNGYQTRSMLCVPVRNGANNTVGVMQVLNKISVDKKASFSDEDEEILTILAAQAGVALHNADTHAVACIARERVKDVLSIVQDMHRDLGFISLMFTISTRVQRFVNSDRCTLYIVDRAKNELWTLQGEVNIRVPLNQGIAGAVAQGNEAINLANAYDDPRFNSDFDQKLGYQTRSVLAMPLRNGSGEVIAVVQLINKLDSSGVFSTDDEELLGTFLQIAGPILFNSHSHLTISSTQVKDDIGTEFTGKSSRGGQEMVEMNVISENDEEEALYVMPPPSLHVRAKPAKSPQQQIPEPVLEFNDSKLVLAIQALDAAWKNAKYLAASEEGASCRLSDSLRDALCTLLELVAYFNKPESVNISRLETVCTARVLGCLKRFVAINVDGVNPIGECCERKCEQKLLHFTLLSILFCMCRDRAIACSVMKEKLHNFIIKMCTTDELSNLETNLKEEQRIDLQDEEPFDPNDLMITIDPFDWCYKPVCTRLFKENIHAFFLPVGIRSLVCLLRGTKLPTDEISEFEQQTHRNRGRTKCSKCRKLPSIFSFPHYESRHQDTNKDHDLSKAPSYELTPLCFENRSASLEQQEIRALWTVVVSDGSRIHLAVRSLIALAICLPQPSHEYKYLLLDRGKILPIFQAYFYLPSISSDMYQRLESTIPWRTSGNEKPLVKLLPFQIIAAQLSTLKRLARAASLLFANNDNVSPVAVISMQHISTRERPPLSPIKKTRCLSGQTKKMIDNKHVSIQDRLNTVSIVANDEFVRWKNRHPLQQQSPERNHRRLAIKAMCADAESLRSHLVRSLEILCSGRQHPDPHQSFSDWIKSLPTLETLERERQYQQEMRQRQILEQQYQREALRRREREESVIMQLNDYNVPKESELTVQQEKHEHFRRMQAEIRQLERSGSDDDTPNEKLKGEFCANALEKMRREDLYYVERILQAKAKTKEEQDKRERTATNQASAIEEQRKLIARMRLLDEEKRLADRESMGMRVEDLLGRQMRFREAEKKKEELQNEWHERRTMHAEEHDCRSRWTLWDRSLAHQQEEVLRQQRAEARRLKRQQQREEKEIRAAWVESWDENGNKYYYNAVTGLSQWKSPL